MRNSQSQVARGRNRLLLSCASAAVLCAVSQPVRAQEESEAAVEESGAGTIVVTGSRIARPDFNSNSPTVSVDEALLENSSTAALEVSLNKLPQFVPAQTPTAGGDIQPTATNTPGAATISLRGIGANRNLVLVDNRRATPSNASGVVDISTIPAAAIERVEIISGGASATYGADAVAGVTNFILKKNFQGLELDGRVGITQEGDGFEYEFSGIMGADFDDGRGNVSLALSMNTREATYQRDREWYKDLWSNPDISGTAFFNPYPGYIVSYSNAPSDAALNSIFTDTGSAPTAAQAKAAFSLGNISFNTDGTAFGGLGYTSRGLNADFNSEPVDGSRWKELANGAIAYNNTNLYQILPLTRYNALARGNYEINDWIGVFGQAMFSSVTTSTRQEPGPITSGWDVFLPYGTGTYVGSNPQATNGQVIGTGNPSSVILNGQPLSGGATGTPYVDSTPTILSDNPTNPAFAALYRDQFSCAASAIGGCTNNQVIGQFLPAELQTLLNSRPDPNAPFQMTGYMPQDRETFTDVLTYNITAGLEGSVPGTDWTWEAFVNHGESHTFARQTGIYSLERLQTVMSSPGLGQGFSATGNAESGRFGASTGTCTSGLNFYSPPSGGYSEDCLEAVSADLKNRSKMRQTIAEANLQGGLFELPAGTLRFALGASYRENEYEFTNDTLTTQGSSFLDQALGIYPSGDSYGLLEVKEVYGELLIPVLAGIPFIQEFNLEVGGRISDYNTTGTSYTYKALGDWQVTDWLRFRGGYNRAERAPNIGELFLSAQQIFGSDSSGDVCARGNLQVFSTNPTTNANGTAGALDVEAVCRAQMAASGNADAAQTFYGSAAIGQGSATAGNAVTTAGFGFPTAVGNSNLVPEKADTWTAGVVVQSPVSGGPLSRLRLSVDWYDITIHDAIGLQNSGAIRRQCYDPAFNPLVSGARDSAAQAAEAAASQYCALLTRTQTGGVGNVYTTYSNTGYVHLQGIDTQVDWALDVGPGTLTVNALVNYQMNFESSALYPTIAPVDYVGTMGTTDNGLNQGAYEYRVLTTVGYGIGPARVALQWQHYPSVEDAGEATTVGGTPSTAGYPSYNLFNFNGSYQVTEDVGLRFGVDNLFNQAPPLGLYNPTIASGTTTSTGQLRGGSYNSTFYDTSGRRFYIGGNVRF